MRSRRLFAPVPLRSMAMKMSGLHYRVLICVASHDRMSIVTGKGQGCRAGNLRMMQMVDCSFARLCSTLSILVDLGLLAREQHGRHTNYRVIYSDEDELLFSNVSDHSIGCRTKSSAGSTCSHLKSSSGGKLRKKTPQYIPLNDRINREETAGESSAEDRCFATRTTSRMAFASDAGGKLARLERALSVGEVIEDLGWYEYVEKLTDKNGPGISEKLPYGW